MNDNLSAILLSFSPLASPRFSLLQPISLILFLALLFPRNSLAEGSEPSAKNSAETEPSEYTPITYEDEVLMDDSYMYLGTNMHQNVQIQFGLGARFLPKIEPDFIKELVGQKALDITGGSAALSFGPAVPSFEFRIGTFMTFRSSLQFSFSLASHAIHYEGALLDLQRTLNATNNPSIRLPSRVNIFNFGVFFKNYLDNKYVAAAENRDPDERRRKGRPKAKIWAQNKVSSENGDADEVSTNVPPEALETRVNGSNFYWLVGLNCPILWTPEGFFHVYAPKLKLPTFEIDKGVSIPPLKEIYLPIIPSLGFGVDLASPNAKPGVPGTTYDIGINFVPIYLLGKMLNVENPPGNYYSAGASVIFSF